MYKINFKQFDCIHELTLMSWINKQDSRQAIMSKITDDEFNIDIAIIDKMANQLNIHPYKLILILVDDDTY